MAEVQSHNRHSGMDELLQNGKLLGRRTDGGNDLRHGSVAVVRSDPYVFWFREAGGNGCRRRGGEGGGGGRPPNAGGRPKTGGRDAAAARSARGDGEGASNHFVLSATRVVKARERVAKYRSEGWIKARSE
mmetsp:Transcript_38101/g.83675  ORF Transcript_38101/g.83675 Transcript_38101/m.83675 type:complete len:131 (-) Transcript_38101:24-416(-)